MNHSKLWSKHLCSNFTFFSNSEQKESLLQGSHVHSKLGTEQEFKKNRGIYFQNGFLEWNFTFKMWITRTTSLMSVIKNKHSELLGQWKTGSG